MDEHCGRWPPRSAPHAERASPARSSRYAVRVAGHAGDRHDLASEGHQRQRNHLPAGDTERDPDDGEHQKRAREQMQQGQFPAEEDDPHDIADHWPNPSVASPSRRPAEWPNDETRQAEGSDAEWDRDDEYECEQTGYDIADREPESGEHQPQDVAYCLHETTPADSRLLSRPQRGGRRAPHPAQDPAGSRTGRPSLARIATLGHVIWAVVG